MRTERRRQALTLEEMYAATGVTTRLLSQFERGKASHASLSRVMHALQALGLELLESPRNDARRVLASLKKAERSESS